jgi:hypothetical protein
VRGHPFTIRLATGGTFCLQATFGGNILQLRRLAVPVVLAIVLTSCGGTGAAPAGDDAPGTTVAGQPGSGETGGTAGVSPGSADDEVTPEASGALEPNTIRIGSQVWHRTLPMTSGQCVVFKTDGTLPDWGNVWGPLDGDDDTLRFAARYGQDGTFEAQVSNDFDIYWGAGTRFQAEEADLVIELDFDNLMVTGNGTFRSLNTGESAMGSFTFTCQPEDQ